MDKTCNKCFVLKSYSEFYVNVSLAHGHSYTCKDCEKAYQLEYKRKRRANPEFRKEENEKDLERYRRNSRKYNDKRLKRYYKTKSL